MERLLLTNKSYARDNRLIIPKSPHCRDCLAPRCRLILSWIRRKIQGYVCSTFNKVRELGLELVRQFGPYLPWVKENCEALSLVREDRDGHTSGAPVVTPVARPGS